MRLVLLLWVSATLAEVLVQPDFDAKKFSGLWYVVSMVSDCKVFLGKKDHLLMSTKDINATKGGCLNVHMEFPRADGCAQVDATFLKMGSEGHFRVPGMSWGHWDCSPGVMQIVFALRPPAPPPPGRLGWGLARIPAGS
ncbi:Hypothetical predicted protein [Marmota monax]|uniref:Uncharacterized protein n=1 Tax=Marmota monax TaxID=9995 RepID=A0A5E4AC66_MARMO|nr:Hypothetical predicted protein [Marmota monax]